MIGVKEEHSGIYDTQTLEDGPKRFIVLPTLGVPALEGKIHETIIRL